MRGKVVMVTVANVEMGKVIAWELARQGATVVMVRREPDKGKEAWREILQATRNPYVDPLTADLSSQQSVREAARRLVALDPTPGDANKQP